MLANLESKLRRIIIERPNSSASDMKDCIDALLEMPISSEQLRLIERLFVGDIVPDHALTPGEDLAFLEYAGWARMANILFENGVLTYNSFKRSILRANRVAECLGGRKFVHDPLDRYRQQIRQFACDQHLSKNCLTALMEYAEKMAWKLALELSHREALILRWLDYFQGSRYLFLVAQYHAQHLAERFNLKPQFTEVKDDSIVVAIVRMLRNFELEKLGENERQILVTRLREFPESTLQALLPSAYEGQQLLVEALNWQEAYPLVDLIKRTSLQTFTREEYTQIDIPNSPDPTSGVIKVAEVQFALEQAGETLAKQVCNLFRNSGEEVANTLTLIEAVAGWNRVRIEKGLKSYSQIAIKAYGLLPLEHGAEDILQRYLKLKQVAKDGKKFGQMRRASHAGAVQASLANLAQIAGYTDISRFEWDMEAKVADEIAPTGRSWQVDGYEIELIVDGTNVNLLIKRDGHILKSIPKLIRSSQAYLEAKEAVQQLRSQVSRLRTDLLEGLLVSGEMLSPDQFKQFLRLPLAQSLFQTMVWRTEEMQFGIFDATKMVLRGLNGQQHPVVGSIGLAHPYHLYHANVLAAWQRELVHQRIVQPLKQVFRELYILTPAEQSSALYSNRFAGHTVDGAIAARLFTSRGWRIAQMGNGATPYKLFGNMRAVFEFTDVWHYLGDGNPVATDQIYFQSYPRPAHEAGQRQEREQGWIPLEQVSPLVFSEAMRDADLVVSVAQREGEARLSNEAYEQRGNLVKALLDDLGLPGVTLDGHFAYVKGKLAQYRVHLGSATIHIEPGNYLCIVPNRWGQKHEKLFLPFADENDSKISEVISKILLLLADDKIKDESILRQIKTHSNH